MCKYCDRDESLSTTLAKTNDGYCGILNDGLGGAAIVLHTRDYDGDGDIVDEDNEKRVPIAFCPFCGRKLTPYNPAEWVA